MNHTIEWYLISARSGSRDLWVGPTGEGRPEYGLWLLPDGRDIETLIFEGRAGELPFPVWFEPFDIGNRLRSLLWTGTSSPLVSLAFVAALESIEATGYRTFEIDLRDRKGNTIPGYVGFLATSTSDRTDVRCYIEGPYLSFKAKPRVVDALEAHGVTDVVIEPFREMTAVDIEQEREEWAESEYLDQVVDADHEPTEAESEELSREFERTHPLPCTSTKPSPALPSAAADHTASQPTPGTTKKVATAHTVEWYEIVARSGNRDFGVVAAGPGRPESAPWTLPDGQYVDLLVAEGRADELPFPVRFEAYRTGSRLRSMIWEGTGSTIVSTALVAALESIEATGYRTFEIDLRDHQGDPIPGYVGLFPTSRSDRTDVRHLRDRPHTGVRVKPHVADALAAHGIDDIHVTPVAWRTRTSTLRRR